MNLKPIVEGIDAVLLLNNSIAASELFSVTDPDGDPITEYVFEESSSANSSGYFIFKGVVQANGAELTIDAADLDELFYVAGPAVGNELISIRASDGQLLSDTVIAKAYTARPESVRPVAIVNNFSVLGNESVLVSSFISAFDPDGFPIQSYMIRDRLDDRSFFSLDGEEVEQGVYRTYTAEEFSRLTYNGVGRSQEEIDVFAFDGTVNSLVSTGVANTLANLNRPVVDFASDVTIQDELLPLLPLINTSDADGSSIKTYELRDRNDKSFSGSLVFRGEVLAAKEFHSFTPDEIDEVFFRGGERNIDEQVRIFVTDGRFRSSRNTFVFTNVATGGGDGPQAGIPVLEADNLNESISEQLNMISMNSLVQQIDDGFPLVTYQVIDTNLDPDSSNLFLNGQQLNPGTIYTFTDDEYENQLNVRTGVFDDRHLDEIYVRGSNGTFNSDWTRLNLHTEPEFFEAFTGLDPNGNEFATWADFILPTGNDPLPITFSFMQQLPDYEIGDVIEENPGRTPTPRLFLQFTEPQKIATRQALAMLQSFANVEFIEVVDSPLTVDPVSGNRGGTLRFGNYYRAAATAIGGADPMADNSTTCAQTFGPSPAPDGGDIWFNVELGILTNMGVPAPSPCGLGLLDFFFAPDVGPGTFEFDTLLDSIAFQNGQGVPFDFVGPDDQNPILPLTTATDSFTVQGIDSFFDPVTGFQLYDVNFFQTIYGANDTYNLGDDVYSPSTLIHGGNARQSIWDAGGTDTISAVGSTIDNVLVDLRPGFFNSIGNLEENVSIAFGAEIENALGSVGNDRLFGNELDNVINGGDGNDVLRGYGGNDLLTGGTGGDRFVFTVGDGDNRINENQLAGRDTIQLIQFPGLDDFTQDLSFRLDGRDLVIQLTLNNSPTSDTTITIEDQTRGAYRIETLEFGTSLIDLENLTNQATGANQQFQLTPESTIFGNLVTPV